MFDETSALRAPPRSFGPGLRLVGGAARGEAEAASPRLWLAVHLPRLPVEALCRAQQPGAPFAVLDGPGARARVLSANAQAEAEGVRRAMGAAAAAAACPGLRLLVRDAAVEAAALEGLATWCTRLSSVVSLVPPSGVVLEVGGSLRLFGGLTALRDRLRRGAVALGLSAAQGVAPTPLGAWLLARAGIAQAALSPAALAARLVAVPVALTDLAPPVRAALLSVGATRLGDCRRLPRDGLGRRLGPEVLEYLDRALGRRPDPRIPYRAPATFERSLVLPAPVDDLDALLYALERALRELAGLLVAHEAGALAIEAHLTHEGRPATRVTVGTVAPSRDPRRLHGLLAERLRRLELPAPSHAVGVRASEVAALAPAALSLEGGRAARDEDWGALLERLSARLGRGAVRGLAVGADHRPEIASRIVAIGTATPPGADGVRRRRPLWLLERPRLIHAREGRPWLDGPLALRAGPERVESGWWDLRSAPGDVVRDYFVAEAADGRRYWIYHERRRRRWWLHGVFA